MRCGVTANAWFLLLVCSIFAYTCNGLLSSYVVQFGALLFLPSALEFWVLEGGSIFSYTNPLSSFVSDRCRESWSLGSRGRGPILPYLMHLGSFIWNCVRVFRMRICCYVTQWSATRFYGSPSVYNRPLPSEKIVPLTAQLKSPSGNPCYDYYHFQLKYPRKAVAYRRKWCHLTCDAGVTWTVGIANDRQQLENGASALMSLERWRKATVRCPVVMMRTLWTLLTKICNVQFVMWLYENRFWLDVAIDFVKNAWSDTWWGTLNISFCYLILPHGCKKKYRRKVKT